MRHLLFLMSLLLTANTLCFSQGSVENNRSIFLNGIQLEKPNYNFEWSFNADNIPKEKFIHYQIDKKGMSAWTHIKFDTVFLNGFLLRHVIVKATKKQEDDRFKMSEFIGIVDFETLDKMTTFFNYNWKGWIFCPEENPLYRFRFHKDKKEGFIVIEAHRN